MLALTTRLCTQQLASQQQEKDYVARYDDVMVSAEDVSALLNYKKLPGTLIDFLCK